MYSRVMVPLDGSAFSEHAIPFALEIAGRTGADVELAHVHVRAPDDGLSGLTPYQFQDAATHYMQWDRAGRQQELERIAAKASALAEETGLSVSGRLLSGQVLHALLIEAESFHADLIVMATHARTGLQRARFGSVADLVVRNASVPVLLVRPSTPDRPSTLPGAYRQILVPLDGSSFSEAAVGPAAAFARMHGAQIMLIHVARKYDWVASDYLDRVAASSTALGVETQFETIHTTRTAEGILKAARWTRTDLIALATHGRGGVTRLVMGSTASDVLAGTQLPVLLQKPATLPTTSSADFAAAAHA